MLSFVNTTIVYVVAGIVGFIGTLAYILSGSLLGLPLIFLGPTLAIVFHEAGHAGAAWQLGMNVQAIAVGPLELRLSPMRLGLSETLGHDVGGQVTFDDTKGRYLTRSADTLITAAGPAANLTVAAMAFALAQFLPQPAHMLLAGFGFTSLAAFVLSAWPMRMISGTPNDALQLVRIHRVSRRARTNAKSKRSPWQAR